MGRGIIQVLTVAGLEVMVHDQNADSACAAVEFVTRMLDRAAQKGTLSREVADAAAGRIHTADSLDALAPADLVVEAIVESLEPKQRLFAALEKILGPDTVLATNTSSLPVTAIASGCADPSRVIGLHFFNPAPLMKVVEIIAGLRTRDEITDAMIALAGDIGHRAILCRDAPGFLINHAARGLLTEALRIVEECVASEADVDRVMREAAGFRMGPFELLDLTGLDVSLPVLELIYTQFHHDPRYRPSHQPAIRVAGGLFGRKSGEGFYVYHDGVKQEPQEAQPPEISVPRLWIHPEARKVLAPLLDSLADADHRTEMTARPPADAALVVAPWGEDATTCALRLGLAPSRVVALDPMPSRGARLTLMATPATAPEVKAGVHRALLAAGFDVTVINDSPGFIAQRILAMIVNIGCEIAQMRIATPADIDDGVRIGLGYPIGPLALGDAIGPERVFAILESLQACYRDPRYRPSIWLRRRAMLGISLSTSEV